MPISRRCPDCQTFTKDSDHCDQCGKLINFEKIRKAEIKKQKETEILKRPDKLDQWLESFKNSRYLLVRGLYFCLHSVWVVFMAIVSFFIFLTAAFPG